MTLSAVSLRGVAKTFSSGTEALAPTDLDIADGSFVAIVGPSGCGKSTLLRMIAGLAEATAGEVQRGDGAVGFVFQSPTLMPWATARENCALPLALTGSGSDAGDALARVGLAGFEGAYPHELSGGMQMRVSIARAMVTRPRLLLMDEPFAALDELTRFKLNDDLLTLWKQNRWTVVFVTHSIREAVFLAERVVVLSPRPGRIVADIAVALPDRAPGARLSHAFTDQCARVSAALEGAA
ncbi:MAG: ABC transporter ATP-binding protein [Rhodospirillaceae bacterium]|nr:ABC transporter ATP-binding protein [Rhodospirillaceae bacterium]